MFVFIFATYVSHVYYIFDTYCVTYLLHIFKHIPYVFATYFFQIGWAACVFFQVLIPKISRNCTSLLHVSHTCRLDVLLLNVSHTPSE